MPVPMQVDVEDNIQSLRAKVANAMLQEAGMNNFSEYVLKGTIDTLITKGASTPFPGIVQGFFDETLPEPEMHQKALKNIVNQFGDLLPSQVKEEMQALADLPEDHWAGLYATAIGPKDIEALGQNYDAITGADKKNAAKQDAEIEENLYYLMGEHVKEVTLNGGGIRFSGDFNYISASDATKYQIGLAAVNAVSSSQYYGHTSPISHNRDVAVMVVDNMQQAHAVFNGLDKAPNMRFPFENKEQLAGSIVKYSGTSEDGVRQEVILVSRDYLKANLAAGLEHMKAYEENIKNSSITSGKGEQSMEEFLQQMQQDSPLPVESYQEYKKNEAFKAPLAERAGGGGAKAL